MTTVTLVLHPTPGRNRSMRLYGERLVTHQPADASWTMVQMPALPGRWGYRFSEPVMPRFWLPRVGGDVAHVLDHAHSSYVRALRQPTVVTVHDLIPLKWQLGRYPVPERMTRRAAWWFRRNIRDLARADRIVCPSQATANDVRELLDLDATVVPHGVDAVFFRPEGERPWPAQRRVLLQVSGGQFYKNGRAVLDTFIRLAAEIPDLYLLRIGAGLTAGEQQRLAAAGLGERVSAWSDTPVRALANAYAHAACLLHPSWDEGFSWPVLEAMAAGCPVVASNAGALRETAAPAALTAAPDDVDALTTHVRSVLLDPAVTAQLRERGRAHAARYRWTDAAAAMAAVYESLA